MKNNINLRKKINVGVIGLGVGEQHLIGYLKNNSCEVKKVCDKDPQKIEYILNKYKNLPITLNANEILNDPEIDLVSIASFDNFHHDQVLMALNNNKHVFIEKPLCLTRKELENIQKIFYEKKTLILTSNFILRKTKRFIDLREKIRSKELGKVYYLEGDYDYGRFHKIKKGWRGKIKNYSVVHGGAIHMIDLLAWFIDSKIIEVFAYGNKFSSKNLKFIGNDMVTSLLKFEDGTVAKISANFPSITPHHHKLTIYGTEATFLQGHLGACYIKKNEEKPFQILNDQYPGTEKGDLINNLVNTILKKDEIEVSHNEIFKAMNISLCIEESILKGQPIRVEDT